LTRKAIELALAGDTVALRLCLERIIPARKSRPTGFAMPKLETVADVPAALATVATAISEGVLTVEEGAAVAGMIEVHRKAIETCDIEARISALEEARR
jgi:hypothetical protein